MIIQADPFEVLVTAARADGDVRSAVSDRCDIWHRYGQDPGDWPLIASSLIFVPAGGQMSQDSVSVTPLVEARCYGDTPFDCGQVWQALLKFSAKSDTTARRVVAVTGGSGLLYRVNALSHPTLLFDEDIRPGGGMPFYSIQCEFEAALEFVA